MLKRALAALGALGIAVSGLLALSAVPAGATTVEDCVFVPELCILGQNTDGSPIWDLAAFADPETGGFDIGKYGEVTGAYARQQKGDDVDGNGIPDFVEFAFCGAAGCLPGFVDTLECERITDLGLQDLTKVVIPMKREEPDWYPGKPVTIFALSEPTVLFSGVPDPAVDSITVDMSSLAPGEHRLVYAGIDSKPEASCHCFLLSIPGPTTTTSTTGGTTTGGTTTGGTTTGGTTTGGTNTVLATSATGTTTTTTANTGSDVGPLVAIGGGLVLLGSAMAYGVRERRRSN